MTITITATFAILALLGWIMSMPNRLQRLTQESIKNQDLSALISELKNRPEELRVRSFNKALSHLWDAQAYALSVECLQHLLEEDPVCVKGHKWLRRMLEEQPDVVKRNLSLEVLKQYRPGLAEQCDSAG